MKLEYVVPSPVAIPDHSQHVFIPIEESDGIEAKICLLGIEEYRGNEANEGCEKGPDQIRKQLFQLRNFPGLKVVDAGNIKMGVRYNDSFYALLQTVTDILSEDLIPIILGGDKTLLIAIEKAFHTQNKNHINLIHIDESFHLGDEPEEVITPENYLDVIINSEPNLLFNLTQLGYQSFYVDDMSVEILRKMDFECYRLGELRADMREIEPVVRDGDLMAFNISALRGLDGPGYYQPSPNGFTAVELCQVFRYAGLSDRLSCLGIFGYNPNYDPRNHSAQVIAQAIWYFMQGVAGRKSDYPIVDEKDFHKYVVSSKELGYDITFLKSNKSDRWWIRIPDEYVKYKSHQLFPCSYKDYQMALADEIPERWWKAYNKLV